MKYLSILFLLLCSSMAWADNNALQKNTAELASTENEKTFQDGRDYFSYTTPINMQLEKGRVQIQSFFDYDCRTCVNVQDILVLYQELNSDRVSYEEYPIATANAHYSAQVFYSLHQMKRDDVSDLLLFETTEVSRYIELAKLENLSVWLQQHQVDEKRFNNIFYANSTIKLVNSAIARTEKYGVFTYPFVVINGKYVLTISTLYNDDYTFAVLDYLVNKVILEQQDK
ncbi:thiol:disulfide interchange protein DsbA/DsbL [Lonepinella koalarum]|uniref:Thiol:disulfide interchange protein DsbA n=1 Tax=Lonepinella koalarum TaxID=53417 RepID=A0A4R1KYA5_9PAST|nr:thiol:disulfide interchange protein DsbA/DsbL [Lonepinella koalarum]TCK70475.1 thiol:disulfide interchange protein DsbA [Lonepinella koalarum]